MDRRQQVLAVLQYDLANGYVLEQVCDSDWLQAHVGGFSPIVAGTVGTYRVCVEQVVGIGEHLSDEGFTGFVEAIRVWQKGTLTDYLFGVPADLVVAKFCQDHPEEGRTLLALAAHHGVDPVVFFGAGDRDVIVG